MIAHALAAAAVALSPTLVGEPQDTGVLRFPQAVAYSPGGSTIVVGDQFSGRISVFGAGGDPRFTFSSRAKNADDGRIGVVGGVATDASGRIFVLDSENHRIEVFSSTGQFISKFGDSSMFTLLGGNAEAAAGISAGGIAVGAGAVFVADAPRDRVARIPFDGTNFGIPTFTVPGLLDAPQGLTVDPNGSRLYVADDVNDRIAVLDPTDLHLITAVGSHGRGAGQFDAPYDVAVDATRRMYVADDNNGRVGVFNADSLAWLGAIGRAGRGLSGDLGFVRSVGALADAPAGGVAVADTANDRIQIFDPVGNALAMWGVPGRGPGFFTRPRGIAFAPDGGMAVADMFDHRIERIAPDGTYGGQYGLIGVSAGYATAGDAAGQYNLPQGVAYDAAGHMWVADTGNDRVVALDAAGNVLQTVTGFDGPRGIAPGPSGSVLIADTGNGQVKQLTFGGAPTILRSGLSDPVAVAYDGTEVFVADANGVLGLTSGTVAPPSGSWDTVSGLAAAPNLLFVSERALSRPGGARVLRRDHGVWDTLATEGNGAGQVIEPAGLAYNGTTLLVADSGNNRVLRFDPPGVTPPQPPQLSVAVDTISRGQVTSDQPGIACPSDCSQHLTGAVTLTAAPVAGSSFAGWGGACAGIAPTCAVPMSGAQAVSASFVPTPPVPAPSPAPTPPPPPKKVTPPVKLTKLKVSPKTLRKSAKVTLTLSRPATLTVTTQLGKPGRKKGSKCVAGSKGRRCTRFVTLAGKRTLRASGSYHFTLKRGKLKPGSYKVAITALDASGNRIGPVTAAFTVSRR